MPDKPKDKPQIFSNPYTVSCDTFSCYKSARWSVGRPDGPLNICQNVCDECVKDIMRHLPAELLEFVPVPEGKVLVDEAELMELRQKAAELDALDEEINQGVDAQAPAPEDKQAPESDSFVCDNPGCDRSFTSKQALIAHQRFCKGAG